MIILQYEDIKTVHDLSDTIDYIQAKLDELEAEAGDNWAKLMANSNLNYREIQFRTEALRLMDDFNRLQKINIESTNNLGEID